MTMHKKHTISRRFRGFLPVVVDVETAGFNPEINALLEIAAIPIQVGMTGDLEPGETIACHVEPFPNSVLDPKALEFTGIDPYHPFRMAKQEREALEYIFSPIDRMLKEVRCSRAILVGHNAFFDLGFIKAAVKRSGMKKMPFHQLILQPWEAWPMGRRFWPALFRLPASSGMKRKHTPRFMTRNVLQNYFAASSTPGTRT
jgi:ribonuclease T